MERHDGRLARLMTQMAEGNASAAFDLCLEYGHPIRTFLSRELRRQGCRRIAPDDLDGLVIDACLILYDCARGWRAEGGALPWVWARARLQNLVSSFVGQLALPIDDVVEKLPPATPQTSGREMSDTEVFQRLAARHSATRLLAEALDLTLSRRDRDILLAVKVQAVLGDSSPAATIGHIHAMRGDAVRQVVHRAIERLRRLARDDPRFTSLADLALLAS